MTLATDDPAATILDNYAEVIEGGTSYPGIPALYSYDETVNGNLTGLTATAGSTTTATIGAIAAADGVRMARVDSPPVYLVCLSQATLTGNVGAARKITAHNGTDTFTVSKAFTDAVVNTDTFGLREGFKRLQDGQDLDGAHGKERFFQLRLMPGHVTGWYGAGNQTYESTLMVRVRIADKNRKRNEIESMLDSALRIRSYLPRPGYRDNVTQLVEAMTGDPSVIREEGVHIVEIPFRIVYRVDATIK